MSGVDPAEIPDLHDALEKAENFAKRAAQASTDQERDHFLQMEKTWRTIAAGWRAIAKVEKP